MAVGCLFEITSFDKPKFVNLENFTKYVNFAENILCTISQQLIQGEKIRQKILIQIEITQEKNSSNQLGRQVLVQKLILYTNVQQPMLGGKKPQKILIQIKNTQEKFIKLTREIKFGVDIYSIMYFFYQNLKALRIHFQFSDWSGLGVCIPLQLPNLNECSVDRLRQVTVSVNQPQRSTDLKFFDMASISTVTSGVSIALTLFMMFIMMYILCIYDCGILIVYRMCGFLHLVCINVCRYVCYYVSF
eukprot:TRINITY_DN10997_c0_g1_i3.p1 TRINITY_DN10997_c0_g1~~TRINITY_DN10997_c0_g1_i3.p1  ORF type:complete len:246 (-),score=-5.71 TRINITY_DN10997_c0_g1_i3:508-1245(-)